MVRHEGRGRKRVVGGGGAWNDGAITTVRSTSVRLDCCRMECLIAVHRYSECMGVVEKESREDQDNPNLHVVRAQLHILFGQVRLEVPELQLLMNFFSFLSAQFSLQRCVQLA